MVKLDTIRNSKENFIFQVQGTGRYRVLLYLVYTIRYRSTLVLHDMLYQVQVRSFYMLCTSTRYR